jgi:hypothetical protein
MENYGSKSLGGDDESTLEKKLFITQIVIDAPSKSITIQYNISLVASNGFVVKTIKTGTYVRYNDGTKNKYDELKSSPIGQAILGLIQLDVNAIQSDITIDLDLKQ